MRKKLPLALLAASALVIILFFVVRLLQPRVVDTAVVPTAAPSGAGNTPAPSTPFDPQGLAPGERASKASLARLESRLAEIRESRTQLSVKMQTINDRLSDASQEANAATLGEAKRALELSLGKMQAEERALVDFIRNELSGPPVSP
jgi:hypothetical protein